MRYFLVNSLLMIAVLLSCHGVIRSQTFVWQTPLALSDSIAVNKNTVIRQLDYFEGISYYAFWERSADSISTDIYVKNFYSIEPPQALVYEGDYHYQNPQIITDGEYYPNDTMFYLLFEADLYGNKDIFIVEVKESGISDLVAVSSDGNDDTHMRCNDAGSIVWENDGKIFFASLKDKFTPNWYITDPIILSDSNSHGPVISCSGDWSGIEFLAWEQHSDTNIAVWSCNRYYPDSMWSAPVMIYDSGFNTNLRFNNDFFDFGLAIMVWDYENNGTYKVKGYDFHEGAGYTSDFSQDHPYSPCILPMDFIVTDFWDISFLSFQGFENDTLDIFVNEDPYISPGMNLLNLTNDHYPEHNPQLFEGKVHSYYKDFILVWESERNNQRQIWSSVFTMPMGAVGEGRAEQIPAKAYPNPFTTSTTIEYELNSQSNIHFSVYNLMGELVYENDEGLLSPGYHSVIVSLSHQASGIYYGVLRSDDGVSVVKMIKQ